MLNLESFRKISVILTNRFADVISIAIFIFDISYNFDKFLEFLKNEEKYYGNSAHKIRIPLSRLTNGKRLYVSCL